MMTAEELKSRITTDMTIELLSYLGAELYQETNEYLVFSSICHNSDSRKLYYYQKDSGLEIDFVMRYNGECVLLECKARTGNVKSAKTILQHPEKYHVNAAIKLGDYNIGRVDKILL